MGGRGGASACPFRPRDRPAATCAKVSRRGALGQSPRCRAGTWERGSAPWGAPDWPSMRHHRNRTVRRVGHPRGPSPSVQHPQTVPLGRGGAGEVRGARGDGTCSSHSGASQPLNPSGFPPPADGEKSVLPARIHPGHIYVFELITAQLSHPWSTTGGEIYPTQFGSPVSPPMRP